MKLKKLFGFIFLLITLAGLAGSGNSGSDCSDNNYALTHLQECSVGCDNNNYALTHPNECAVGCDNNDYALAHSQECSQVPPTCEEKFLNSYRCSPNGFDRQREKLKCDGTKEWVTLETCTFGCQKVWVDSSLPVSCIIPPPLPFADNAPSVTINVPASAAPSSQMSVAVTGTDNNDVAQLLLYDASNNQIGVPFDCVGIQTSCSNTFTVTVPSTFSTAYSFKARSKDSAGQVSDFRVQGFTVPGLFKLSSLSDRRGNA